MTVANVFRLDAHFADRDDAQTSGFRPVDLVEIGESVGRPLRTLLRRKESRSSGDRGKSRWLITGTRTFLFDALANLVDNAIKHGREAGKVVVRLDRCDHGAVISVADNGRNSARRGISHVFPSLLPARAQPLHAGQWAGAQPCRRGSRVSTRRG